MVTVALPFKKSRVVWIAEDDEAMRQLLVATLQRDPITVEAFVNGAQVLARFNAAMTEGPLPDLMVLDHHMPEVHGLEVVEILNNDLTDIPVIIITAYGDIQTHTRAVAQGVAAIFDKPFDLTQLFTTSIELLNGRR